MKIREGFISNSSTTSFVCDYCGHEAAGMDLSIRDAGMRECNNGHTFCADHAEIDESQEGQQKLCEEALTHRYNNYLRRANQEEGESKELHLKWAQEALEERDEVVALEGEGLEDWLDNEGYDLLSDLAYEMPTSACPLCQFQETSDRDLITYLLAIVKLTRKAAEEEMRNRFKSYEEFKSYCEGRTT